MKILLFKWSHPFMAYIIFFQQYFKVPESNPFVVTIHIQKQPLSFILSWVRKKNE